MGMKHLAPATRGVRVHKLAVVLVEPWARVPPSDSLEFGIELGLRDVVEHLWFVLTLVLLLSADGWGAEDIGMFVCVCVFSFIFFALLLLINTQTNKKH